EKALADWQVPGLAVLVVKDGQVVLQRGYGYLEDGKPEKVDEHTLFMIASNTKAFTGTALAILDIEGKCSMEDRVVEYLPEFRMKDPWVTETVTITDMLTHRLGMETFQGDFMYWESDLTRDEVIEKFGMLTPMYDFRAKWGYCNAGYVVAGACLEQISGMSWEQFIRERFIVPLNMNRTLVMTRETADAENIAVAHTLVDGKLQKVAHCQIDNIAPAASISSSVHDLSHWLIALLDSGRYQGRQVIPYQAIVKAQYPQSIIRRARHPFNESNYSLYGLGWDLQDYEGKEIISHTGGVDGFVTSVALIPSEKLGVVVLTNTDMNGLYQALKWEVFDAYLGLPYRNYSQAYLHRYKRMWEREQKMVNAWRDSTELKIPPSVDLNKFEGTYRHEVYGKAFLNRAGNHLVLSLEHHSNLTAKLEHIGGDRFLATYSHPLWGIKMFPFIIENGQVKSFTLSVADFLEFTTYEFVKE
ncbi:MAG: serine hydrolase, partial [Bacteroidales bacterium]